MSKTILEDYVKNVQVDSDVQELEKKLRDVAAELTRTGLYRGGIPSIWGSSVFQRICCPVRFLIKLDITKMENSSSINKTDYIFINLFGII